MIATMHPSGHRFNVLPGQSLLDSGLSTGNALPFGCANGSCGDCRARILSGQVKKIRNHDFTLTEAQKLDGYCLLCSNTALTDVDIEVLEARSVNDVPLQSLQAKPCRCEQTDNVDLVTFKFVRGKALRFLPGQSATVVLPDTTEIALPIASCPCNAQVVEFHLFTEDRSSSLYTEVYKKVHQAAVNRERVIINGPTGNFTLHTDISKPIIFFAQGNEFARLQGMIEQVLNSDLGKPCCLVWQASADVTQYRSNLCRSWHDAFDEFTYLPLSAGTDPLADLSPDWQSQLCQSNVYLGSERAELRARLTQHGVASNAIFYPREVPDC